MANIKASLSSRREIAVALALEPFGAADVMSRFSIIFCKAISVRSSHCNIYQKQSCFVPSQTVDKDIDITETPKVAKRAAYSAAFIAHSALRDKITSHL